MISILISISGIPVKRELERRVMKRVIGNGFVTYVSLMMTLLHALFSFIVPYALSVKDNHRYFRFRGDFLAFVFCIPLWGLYIQQLIRTRPALLKRILEDQSLNTAFKHVVEDLERGSPEEIETPQFVGTEMHREAVWLYTKAAFLFSSTGWAMKPLIYKLHWYIPRLSLLLAAWVTVTSTILFGFAFYMNDQEHRVCMQRRDKKMLSTAS